MALFLDRVFRRARVLVGSVVFTPQASAPGNSDGRPEIWCDSSTLIGGYQTLQFGNLNLKGIGDINCNSLHVDPSAAGSSTPYVYTTPNASWLFCDSVHPPTMPEARMIDQVTRNYVRVQVSNGTLRTFVEQDQSISY